MRAFFFILTALFLSVLARAEREPEDVSSILLKLREGSEYFSEDAIKDLEKIAEKPSARALEVLGQFFLEGNYGIATDIARAHEYLKRAVELPDAKEAFYFLGQMTERGLGTKASSLNAVGLMQEGVERGSAQCMLALANLYAGKALGEPDYTKALELCKQAAAAGSAEGFSRQAILYEYYLEGAPDWENAYPLYLQAANGGSGEAAYRLAQLAASGECPLLEKDDTKAEVFLIRSGLLGYSKAAYEVARSYELKEVKDVLAMTAWMKRGAELGDVQAANAFGQMLLAGNGITQNSREAYSWFVKAANAGLATGMVNVGYLLELGLGTEKNPKQAFQYYNQAAKLGHPDSYLLLSKAYEVGGGVEADLLEAVYWGKKYELIGKDGAAAGRVKELMAELTPEQMEKLQARLEPLEE